MHLEQVSVLQPVPRRRVRTRSSGAHRQRPRRDRRGSQRRARPEARVFARRQCGGRSQRPDPAHPRRRPSEAAFGSGDRRLHPNRRHQTEKRCRTCRTCRACGARFDGRDGRRGMRVGSGARAHAGRAWRSRLSRAASPPRGGRHRLRRVLLRRVCRGGEVRGVGARRRRCSAKSARRISPS